MEIHNWYSITCSSKKNHHSKDLTCSCSISCIIMLVLTCATSRSARPSAPTFPALFIFASLNINYKKWKILMTLLIELGTAMKYFISLSGEILFAEYTLQTLSKYSEAISFWAVSRITGSGTDFDFRSPMIAFRISGIQP